MKRFEYQIMPLFGIKNSDFAGAVRAQYHLLPQKYFQRVDFSVSASQFALYEEQNYQRLKVSTDFWIRTKSLSNTGENHIIASATSVSDQFYRLYNDQYVNKVHLNLSMIHKNNRRINPYQLGVYCEGNSEYLKSWLEAKYKINYEKLNKGLRIRFFAGKFLYEKDEYFGNYNFRLSGWNSNNDYKYDHLFLARNESARDNKSFLLENQFVQNDGGFAIYSYKGQTNNWMLATNITVSLPIPPPINLYLNTGSVAEKIYIANSPTNAFTHETLFLYEFGVSVTIVNEAFEIFFKVESLF